MLENIAWRPGGVFVLAVEFYNITTDKQVYIMANPGLCVVDLSNCEYNTKKPLGLIREINCRE